jgi:hypothetical protein
LFQIYIYVWNLNEGLISYQPPVPQILLHFFTKILVVFIFFRATIRNDSASPAEFAAPSSSVLGNKPKALSSSAAGHNGEVAEEEAEEEVVAAVASGFQV